MRSIILFTLSFLLIISSVCAQNEFGTVGSYWMYSHHPHSGHRVGTTMISIEKDTLIDGKINKILKKTFHHYNGAENVPPQTGNYIAGWIRVANNAVFIGDELLLDFNMTLNDSLLINGDAPIQMVVDSIGMEMIGGIAYKKWYGQKLCLANGQSYPYETFTMLEHIGQIDDYLFWNTDNCSIGGGSNIFKCYKNGDFTYPTSDDCTPLILSNTQVNDIPGLEIFPNPANDVLNIDIEKFAIKEIIIFDVKGKEIFRKNNDTNNIQINTKGLQQGTYIIQIKTKNELTTRKFVKI